EGERKGSGIEREVRRPQNRGGRAGLRNGEQRWRALVANEERFVFEDAAHVYRLGLGPCKVADVVAADQVAAKVMVGGPQREECNTEAAERQRRALLAHDEPGGQSEHRRGQTEAEPRAEVAGQNS